MRFIICLLILVSCKQEKEPITKKERIIKKVLPNKIYYSNQDTIYYNKDNKYEVINGERNRFIDYTKLEKSHTSKYGGRFRIKKGKIKNGIIKVENYTYTYYKGAIRKENLISTGYVKNFSDVDPVKSGTTGQWRFYDDNGSLHQIGNYKEGSKNGIWYTVYEDAYLPKIEYYKDGVKVNHKREITIEDENGREWIKGSKINLKGIPEGKWTIYNYEENEYYLSNFIINDADVIVKGQVFDLKSNELIREESTTEKIDFDIYGFKDIDSLSELKNSKELETITSKEAFEIYLSKIPFSEEPFSFNKELFSVGLNRSSAPKNYLEIKMPATNENCQNYKSFQDSIYHKFRNGNESKFKMYSCDVIKKYKVSDSISLFLSKMHSSSSEAFTVFSYNNKVGIIDNEYIGTYDLLNYDMYIHNGLIISDNLVINAVNFSYNESPSYIQEKKLQILPSGKIETLYERNFSQDTDSVFYDYVNDYELKQPKPKLSAMAQKEAYTNLLNKTPTVSLPYNSGDFYHYMQIATQEEDKSNQTLLFHNKLQRLDNVNYFFSKDVNQVAFKKEKGEYKEGNYFYPIFQFKRNEDINIIGYLYQSFCNYNPTVYVKLNSYTSSGEIIDEFIADRRFFNESHRFLSSIEIQENYTIDFKRYTEYYNYYEGYEGMEEEPRQPKVVNEQYTITEKGMFLKIIN